MLQTSTEEIYYDLEYGTTLRQKLEVGIDSLLLHEIRDEIQDKLTKYFHNYIDINYLNVYQDIGTVRVDLRYTELRTGIMNSVRTEETIVNKYSS